MYSILSLILVGLSNAGSGNIFLLTAGLDSTVSPRRLLHFD